jgi:hypothetical protein
MNGHDWIDGGMGSERTAAARSDDVTDVPTLAANRLLTQADTDTWYRLRHHSEWTALD